MKPPKPRRDDPHGRNSESGRLRVIAGTLRSRILEFNTDPRTRPMKDRTREAVFNLLGGSLDGFIAIDLFGGSGILAIESLSRGAHSAIVVELIPRVADEIRQNAKRLEVDDRLCLFAADAFHWMEHLDDHLKQLALRFGWSDGTPWCVFVCPPYRLWETHAESLQRLLEKSVQVAPPGSLFAVELDESTSVDLLPVSLAWQTRLYRPALMAIGEKPR